MQNRPNESRIPTGFISFEDALALIDSDTRADAKVDIKFLMDNINFVESKHNLNIPLLKTENGRVFENGHVYVQIGDEAEKFAMRKKIQSHFEELSGRKIDVNQIGLKRVTTMVNDENNIQGRPQVNTESDMTYNSEINSGVIVNGK